jgi:uncharacterized protein
MVLQKINYLYFMRKKNQEIIDPTIIEEILTESEICRLAMMDGEKPYILPFNYGYQDNCIYIHCAKEGKKIDLLEKNGEVCFEIEHTAELVEGKKACNWTERYRSIVGYGTVEILSDFEEKEHGLAIIMRSNGMKGEITFKKSNVEAVVILKLNITQLTAKQSSNWENVIFPIEV